MRILLFGILLLQSILAFAAGGEWYFDQSINGVEFWKNPTQKECRIVVDKQLKSSNKPLEFYQSDIFKHELQERKKSTLSFFGVHQWSVRVEEVSRKDSDIVVDFSGDYDDQNNEKTYYRERHLYGPQRFVQLLYTCSKKILPTTYGEIFSRILTTPSGLNK
jgi:hypothetical protein